MHSTRLLNALVLALSTISIARATIIDPNIAGRGDGEIERRKADSGISVGLGAAASSTDSQSTTPSSTAKTSSTAGPTSTSTPPTTTSTEAPTTSSTPATTSSTPETTSAPPSSSSSPPAQSTVTLVITTTNSLGSMTSYTTEATTTPSASLSSSQGSTSGMSTQTRNTVIGVVVGVGGAIVLCAIALVAWRIWGRKKSQDEGDGLMGYGAGYNAAEKSEAGGSASGRTPFQSTLESYHAPTQVNQASNF